MMTKFDWNEMKRAKAERRKKEAKIKEYIEFTLKASGGFFLFFVVAAVVGG